MLYIKPKWIEIKAKWIPFSCGGGNVLDHIIVTVAVQKILTAPKLLVSKKGLFGCIWVALFTCVYYIVI